MRIDPLSAGTLAARPATIASDAAIVPLVWLTTGISPWPAVVLGETAGLGLGVAPLTSPGRGR